MPYKFLTKGLNFKQQSDTQYQGSIDLVLDESLKTLKQQYVADLQIEKDNLAGQLNQLKNELVTGIENDITEYSDTLGLTQKQQQIDTIADDLNTIDANIERIGQKLQTTEELVDLFGPDLTSFPTEYIYTTYDQKVRRSLSRLTTNNHYNFITGVDRTNLFSRGERPALIELTAKVKEGVTLDSGIDIRDNIIGKKQVDGVDIVATFHTQQKFTLNNDTLPITFIALCELPGEDGNGFTTFEIDLHTDEIEVTPTTNDAQSSGGVSNTNDNTSIFYDITHLWNTSQSASIRAYKAIPVKKNDIIYLENTGSSELDIFFTTTSNISELNSNTIIDLVSTENNTRVLKTDTFNLKYNQNLSLKGSNTTLSLYQINFLSNGFAKIQVVSEQDSLYLMYPLKVSKSAINNETGAFTIQTEDNLSIFLNQIHLNVSDLQRYNEGVTAKENQIMYFVRPTWTREVTTLTEDSTTKYKHTYTSSLIDTEGKTLTLYNNFNTVAECQIVTLEPNNATTIPNYTIEVNDGQAYSSFDYIDFGIGDNSYYAIKLVLTTNTSTAPIAATEVNDYFSIIAYIHPEIPLVRDVREYIQKIQEQSTNIQTYTEALARINTVIDQMSNYYITQIQDQQVENTILPLSSQVSDWSYASAGVKYKLYSPIMSTGEKYVRVVFDKSNYQMQIKQIIYDTETTTIKETKEIYSDMRVPMILPPHYNFQLGIRADNQQIDLKNSQNFAEMLRHVHLIVLKNTPVRWCVLGDSISEGYVSTSAGSYTTGNLNKLKNIPWVNLFASKKQWYLENKAVGGTGWIDSTSGNTQQGIPKENALTIVQSLLQEEFFKNIDIVTLAWGINDYKGEGYKTDTQRVVTSTRLGDLTMNVPAQWYDNYNLTAAQPIINDITQSMYAIISAIIAQNPAIKIYVLLPINCGISKDYLDAAGNIFTQANNYCMNKKNSIKISNSQFEEGYSLRDLHDRMIQVCEELGVEYIDTTLQGPINRFNLITYLLDGVHPSEDGHKLLARYYNSKINFSKDII